MFKSMHPSKFLGCNWWTLPFPIPAGVKGPLGCKVPEAGLGQLARVRVDLQVKSPGRMNPLDFQQALGYVGEP